MALYNCGDTGADAIIRGLIQTCWFLCKWVSVLAVLPALVVAVFLYTQLDDQIRQRVEQMVSDHYPQYIVRVRAAQLHKGRGIEVRGLSIAALDGGGPDRPLVQIDELLIACQPTLAQLLQDDIDVEHIVVRRPQVRATRGADGRWDVARLLPLPKFGDDAPQIHVQNGVVELLERPGDPQSKLVLRDIDVVFQRQAASGAAGRLPDEPAGPQRRVGNPSYSCVALKGTLSNEYVPRVEVEGIVDLESGGWRLRGAADKVQVCPELLASLPSDLQCRDELRHLHGQAAVQFDVASDPTRTEPLQFNVACQFSGGRLDDPRLPYPLSDIQAELRSTNHLLAIDDLSARHGQTLLRLRCQRQGLHEGAPLSLSATARKVVLDPEMVRRLPDSLREVWNHYQPAGEVDVDLRLDFDGRAWHPDLLVRCNRVGLTYHKFPYRLEQGSGTLAYRGRRLAIDLTAHASEQPVRIVGELLDPASEPTGWLEVRGSEIPLDERLIAALPEEGRKVIRSLDPAGSVQFYWRGWRDAPDEDDIHSHLVVSFNRGSVAYRGFPYPLKNVRGTVELADGRWTFRDLEATNDTALITLKGELLPTSEGGELHLYVAAAEVPLERELRDALPPSAARFWSMLKPAGQVDLTAHIRYPVHSKQPDIALRVEPVGDSVSIEPTAFPYRLEKVRGAITYRNGRIEMENLSARHGAATLLARGNCELRPDDGWHLQLERVSVDRLQLDRELLLAMPQQLRQTLTQLNPSGPLNLHGAFNLSKAGEETAPLQCGWDVAFNLHRAGIDCGIKLTDAYGEVRLVGGFDGQKFQSRGELALDSVTYENVQFTDVLGPLWVDDQRVLLGVWAEKQQGRESRRITARVYGGTVVADGWAVWSPEPRFGLQASLTGASLERVATETLPGPQKLKGQVHGNVGLEGNLGGAHNLKGAGNLRLREADIYELPVVVQLLKVLSVRAPDSTAFTQGDMNFRIEGEHVYFDRLDLLGDAVSLYGKGEMGFNKEIQLSFHSIVGRNELPVPLLQKVVGEASNQIMQIRVRGSLDDPKITSEPFPAVNQALQQLQADLQGKPQEPSSWDPRNWFRK